MLKVLGSACILGGGMLVRYLHALERRREMDTLSDLLSSLRKMAEEIRMARTPLPALLNHLDAGCGAEVGAFFRTAALSARQGRDLPATWRQGAEALPLSVDSGTALEELGNHLCGDEESICKAISLAIYSLAKDAEDCARRRPEEAKRTTALCLSGAALLVILLI